MFRSISYYRSLNIAILLGVAVSAAVLTGALLVGDSVKMSLRKMTLDRLGNISSVILPGHFVSQSLAQGLHDQLQGKVDVAPLVLLQGSVNHDSSRATRVNILGIDKAFPELYSEEASKGSVDLIGDLAQQNGQVFESAVINEALARELNVEAGMELVVSFEKPSHVNRDSLYGRKEVDDVVKRIRVVVKKIIPDSGMGRFSLTAGQRPPMNLFLPIKALQRALEQRKKVNAILVGGVESASVVTLENALKSATSLGDLDLVVRREDQYFSLETPSFFLNPTAVEKARQVADQLKIPQFPVSTYLVNNIQLGERQTPYSLIAAADLSNPLADYSLIDGTVEMGLNEVVLTSWTAEDLKAKVGDLVRVTYYAVSENDSLAEETHELKIIGIIDVNGIGADPNLAPALPGVENADDMSAWDPPFAMDMDRIRDKDEAFWDQYHTAPKILVSQEMGRKLWEGRFGFQTGIRMAAIPGMALEETADKFTRDFLSEADPSEMGLPILPIREQGLKASKGATDFSGLFIGFSLFIIISAMILVGLFFRLSVEQRQTEIGILLSMGYTIKKVRRRFLYEGLLLATVGALPGAFCGLVYGKLMMAALRNWWTLGTSHLYFHFSMMNLVIGIPCAILVALLAIYLTVRQIGRLSVTELVGGRSQVPEKRQGKRARLFAVISLVLALGMAAVGIFTGSAAEMFWGVGAFLLMSGLAFMAVAVSDREVENGITGLWKMAARNTSRQGGRSLVCVSLVACACFVIVALGLSRHSGEADPDNPQSGTGGFYLEAQADIPLFHSLKSKEGTEAYAVDSSVTEILDQTDLVAMRLRGGDDASCLNLFAPQKPRVLGLVDAREFENRFTFKGTIRDIENPWRLLEEPLEDGAIPVIGDQNSVMWILKSGLGKDFIIQDSNGRDVKLRFVGLLQKSIFQSELIIAEEQFRKIFPDESGFRYFLMGGNSAQRQELGPSLEAALAEHGLDATSTSEKMMRFHEIENTYISIFQLLGGLGLLMGTLGLGAIVYRNAMERKGEFAAMRAFGFRRSKLSSLLLTENAVLILLGIGIGSISALIAVAPHLFQSGTRPSVPALLITLVGVFIAGMSASAWATKIIQGLPIIASLRAK